MLCQVIICSVSNTPQFAPSKREEEFYVCSCFAVETQLFFVMVTVTNFVFFKAKGAQPVKAELLPVSKPLEVCIRFTEEFKFHLLELTCTECKVTRCDLVTERFTDLADTERNFFTGCSLYVLKVDKDTLCCFRS